ncbi:hypothetical protein [Acidihalobacter prosperus]
MTNEQLAQFLEECAKHMLDLVQAESFGGWRQRRSKALECAERMKQGALAFRMADNFMEVKLDLNPRQLESQEMPTSNS